MPAVSWSQKCASSIAGVVSRTAIVAITAAAAKNDAASSSATAQPPSQVNSSAPIRGPNSRNDSLVVCREALASTSISSGISSLSRPLSAAGRTMNETPYSTATPQMIQTCPGPRTSTSGRTQMPEATWPQTSSGLRRTRSIQMPSSGANSAGITMKKNVSPACALEPVSVFTQIESTSSITESPNIDAVRPAYRREKPGWRKACLMTRQPLSGSSPRSGPRSSRRRAGAGAPPRRPTRTAASPADAGRGR